MRRPILRSEPACPPIDILLHKPELHTISISSYIYSSFGRGKKIVLYNISIRIWDMANHAKGVQHFHIRKRIHQRHEPYPHPDRHKNAVDKLIYVAVFMGPIMNIPQIAKIWGEKNAMGVSFVSWASFAVLSIIWLAYGIIHREKPIIYMNVVLMCMQAAIATGALVYG
jgi:uncharacterized protein with PQ loop repeat